MDINALDLDLNPYEIAAGPLAAVRRSGLTHGLWPVDSAQGRCVLAVKASGITVFDGIVDRSYSWSELHGFQIGSDGIRFAASPTADPQRYAYVMVQHANEVHGAIQAAGVPVASSNRPSVDVQAARDALRQQAAAVPRQPRTLGTFGPGYGERARSRLTTLFWTGFGLQALGGFLVGIAFGPGRSKTYDPFLGESEGEPGTSYLVVGSLVSSVGALLFLTALIGWAVMLGVRAARTED